MSDGALVEQARAQGTEAFAELWRRYSTAAYAIAHSVPGRHGEADDLVAEAFANIWSALQRNLGPRDAFKPYLRVTITRIAARWDRGSRERLLGDDEDFADVNSSAEAVDRRIDRATVARAFQSLPDQWRQVLWLSEVESLTPRQIASLIDMKPNTVSALAYRAREGLRQAWIRAHLSTLPENSECRWVIERLASLVRHKTGKADSARITAHLETCPTCPVLAQEAKVVGSRLALGLLLVILCGWQAVSSAAASSRPPTGSTAARATAATVILASSLGLGSASPMTPMPPAASSAVSSPPRDSRSQLSASYPELPTSKPATQSSLSAVATGGDSPVTGTTSSARVTTPTAIQSFASAGATVNTAGTPVAAPPAGAASSGTTASSAPPPLVTAGITSSGASVAAELPSTRLNANVDVGSSDVGVTVTTPLTPPTHVNVDLGGLLNSLPGTL